MVITAKGVFIAAGAAGCAIAFEKRAKQQKWLTSAVTVPVLGSKLLGRSCHLAEARSNVLMVYSLSHWACGTVNESVTDGENVAPLGPSS